MGASVLEKHDLMTEEAIFMSFMSNIYDIEVIYCIEGSIACNHYWL